MAFEPEYRDIMPDTVTIRLFVSRDKFGAKTMGAPLTFKARVTEEQNQVSTWQGEQVVSGTTIWCAPDPDDGIPVLTPESEVTLSDGTVPKILRVQIVHDEEGPHHFKIYADRPYRN